MSNHAHATISSDSKRKKPALPSILSNLRNAQAAIGRAADDLHEREIRPLVGGGIGGGGGVSGGRMAASSSQPQLHRTTPSSLSSTWHNMSQRFGSQWRKLSSQRRKKGGNGVTAVPQSFYVAVGCFFFAFPIFFVLYILARHAVFGDEGDISGGKSHIHEVPTSFSNGTDFYSGSEPVEMDQIGDNPMGGIEGAGETGENQFDLQIMQVDPPALIESAAGELQPDVMNDVQIETGEEISGVPDQSNIIQDSIVETNAREDGTEDTLMRNAPNEGDEGVLVPMENESINDLKEHEGDNTEAMENTVSGDLQSISVREDMANNDPSLNQLANEEVNPSMENEAYQNNLRGSHDENE